jgi:hypothetical protein
MERDLSFTFKTVMNGKEHILLSQSKRDEKLQIYPSGLLVIRFYWLELEDCKHFERRHLNIAENENNNKE